VGESAKKTLVAALLAWLLARVLGRLIAVAILAALLAGGLALAQHRGVDVGAVGRIMHCQTRAIVKQLRDTPSRSSPTAIARPQRASRLDDCHPQPAPAAPQRRSPRP
jgi:hypothetical protein